MMTYQVSLNTTDIKAIEIDYQKDNVIIQPYFSLQRIQTLYNYIYFTVASRV